MLIRVLVIYSKILAYTNFLIKIYKQLQSGSSGLVQCAQSLNVAVSTAAGDGSNNNSGNSGNSDRRRRSGLSTVMQRPGMTQLKVD